MYSTINFIAASFGYVHIISYLIFSCTLQYHQYFVCTLWDVVSDVSPWNWLGGFSCVKTWRGANEGERYRNEDAGGPFINHGDDTYTYMISNKWSVQSNRTRCCNPWMHLSLLASMNMNILSIMLQLSCRLEHGCRSSLPRYHHYTLMIWWPTSREKHMGSGPTQALVHNYVCTYICIIKLLWLLLWADYLLRGSPIMPQIGGSLQWWRH